MSLVDQHTLAHLATILNHLQSPESQRQQLHLLSAAIKKNHLQSLHSQQTIPDIDLSQRQWKLTGKSTRQVIIQNFVKDNMRLTEAGITFGNQFAYKIQIIMNELAEKEKVEQMRFWGLVYGTQKNYYVIQGRKEPVKSHEQIPKDSEKEGEGVNYYTYWVSNDPLTYNWHELPNITLQQMAVSRKIKMHFTGHLHAAIRSQPKFPGLEKHYLKAQICRITHSLEIVPKGIYKQNDDNPKIIEFEEQVKFPEYVQVSTNEGWVHRNQMILGLGRCTHYVDLSLPEQEIQAKTNFLTENDPEVERLRGITEDKVPETLNLGLENPWIFKQSPNTQIFTKDENSLVYGIITIRNIFWPGWTTVGYRQGYTNIYIGNGHKSTQSTLFNYTNPDVIEQGQQTQQFPQPYPLQLPPEKPQGEQNQEEQPPEQ